MASTQSKRKTAKPKKARSTKKDVEIIDSSRDQMISEAAYFLAEKRDFNGGDPLQDWLDAEKEIDRIADSSQPV